MSPRSLEQHVSLLDYYMGYGFRPEGVECFELGRQTRGTERCHKFHGDVPSLGLYSTSVCHVVASVSRSACLVLTSSEHSPPLSSHVGHVLLHSSLSLRQNGIRSTGLRIAFSVINRRSMPILKSAECMRAIAQELGTVPEFATALVKGLSLQLAKSASVFRAQPSDFLFDITNFFIPPPSNLREPIKQNLGYLFMGFCTSIQRLFCSPSCTEAKILTSIQLAMVAIRFVCSFGLLQCLCIIDTDFGIVLERSAHH